jgi:hypothetical protein
MKEKINEICNKLNRDQLSVQGATEELLNLFSVSKRHLFESILEDMDNKHPEYHREVLEDYIDGGC